ncbi:PREDICTED: protein NRT1/ PTR FAMILY 2.7-like isoform X1 [Fragaria vesca subsp. vesca]|uniref:protein NRT1/ PTR FAMILY 2.7-like isoform X1 n=1 Tax=Fragaria vesca subsp. vesca TaxID=101020 RepID=UPI0002C34C87|nr:PREDICTED: protein NRT1/ PTR FAMILY 2.7-like isoform X1 [Fragaria vesca subsp. vesca]
MASSLSPLSSDSGSRRGGWITFPFITGALAGLTVASGGWGSNLIVYLIQEFNVKSIAAAQVSNVVSGSINFFPVIGAIIADSLLGSFPVISVSSFISLLGICLLALTATLGSLRPPPCVIGSDVCQPTTKLQLAILYTSITLASIGSGGTRFTLATIGANQFDKPKNQSTFFNWFFFTNYIASVVSGTVIVYVEDNVGWKWGFGICVIGNLIGLAIFLSGSRFYRFDKPQGSPFIGLARVIVASTRKRNLHISSDESKDFYYGHGGVTDVVAATPSKSFRFLNRAAQKMEGDTKPDGSILKPWRLCTVQQVEDFKTLVRILPLWSSSIFLGTPIAVQVSLTILQALTMDRHLGPHFKIPAGSIIVVELVACAFFIAILDRFLCPLWQKLFGQFPTPLQRLGLGHVLNVLGMAVSALVESKRLKITEDHHLQDKPGAITPMLALWLFPQLVLVGVGEAFHFPGQVALYYQEFPVSLRNTSTAMISLIIGMSFYLSTGIIDFVRRVTSWLPDNINKGKLDNVYWMLVVVGVVNFGYYLVCANLYKYQNASDADSSDEVKMSDIAS